MLCDDVALIAQKVDTDAASTYTLNLFFKGLCIMMKKKPMPNAKKEAMSKMADKAQDKKQIMKEMMKEKMAKAKKKSMK
jgi:hypothetical protein